MSAPRLAACLFLVGSLTLVGCEDAPEQQPDPAPPPTPTATGGGAPASSGRQFTASAPGNWIVPDTARTNQAAAVMRQFYGTIMKAEIELEPVAHFREAPRTPGDGYTESFICFKLTGEIPTSESNFRRFVQGSVDGLRSTVFGVPEKPTWTTFDGESVATLEYSTDYGGGITDRARMYFFMLGDMILIVEARALPDDFERHMAACENVISQLLSG